MSLFKLFFLSGTWKEKKEKEKERERKREERMDVFSAKRKRVEGLFPFREFKRERREEEEEGMDVEMGEREEREREEIRCGICLEVIRWERKEEEEREKEGGRMIYREEGREREGREREEREFRCLPCGKSFCCSSCLEKILLSGVDFESFYCCCSSCREKNSF